MYNILMKDTSPERCIAGECMAGRVRVLNRVVSGIYDDALRPYNVRISQMNVLVAVAVLGPVRATDVCRRLKLDKSTLSRDLERLLTRKLVRTTPAGGRTQNLEATEAGRALISEVKPAWDVAQRRVHELLGTPFVEGVFAAVERLRAADEDPS